MKTKAAKVSLGEKHASLGSIQRFRKGFTLAEVLITLGIIGIIAALILPNLLENHEKRVTVTQLRVIYNILHQAQKLSETHNGGIDEWDMGLQSRQFAERYFTPYLKVVETCVGYNTKCWKTDDFYGYYSLSRSKITNKIPYSVVLANGMTLGFIKPIQNTHLVLVDINGNKGPRRMGRDVFSFLIYSSPNTYTEGPRWWTAETGILPGAYGNGGVPHWLFPADVLLTSYNNYSGSSTDRFCHKQASNSDMGNGAACAAVILKNDWKIPDDYPWN